MKHYVDLATQPARFHRLYPAIQDVSDFRSFNKHRQRLFAMRHRGQYTIFVPNREPLTVEWPSLKLQDKYGPRVERLINAALFDQTHESLVEHLFYVVRMGLRLSKKYSKIVARTLHEQFMTEFDWDSTAAVPEDPCECRWSGGEADVQQCLPHCKDFHDRYHITAAPPGIKQLLEKLESKHWVLRIWQRQHPSVLDWRQRLAGEKFPGCRLRDLERERPLMGRAWMGIGASITFGGWEEII